MVKNTFTQKDPLNITSNSTTNLKKMCNITQNLWAIFITYGPIPSSSIIKKSKTLTTNFQNVSSNFISAIDLGVLKN